MNHASDQERQELCRRALGGRKTRRSEFTRERPCKWHPTSLIHPEYREPFTVDNCWTWIAEAIQAGAIVEIITLKKPPGKRGFVLKLDGHAGIKIYVKLQMLSEVVYGRSFHESGANDDEE